VTRDVQYVIDGLDLPTPEVLTAIDRVADQLEPYPGWQIRGRVQRTRPPRDRS
jgi:hypothetical protein